MDIISVLLVDIISPLLPTQLLHFLLSTTSLIHYNSDTPYIITFTCNLLLSHFRAHLLHRADRFGEFFNLFLEKVHGDTKVA